ncbi:UPF0183-domain-containing protein [Lentinula edodes]|uniref:UPF0183-domain-containing protein n=1 Tax=Lentinula edodes TaxID=5353 RepID=A0A1Q3DV93_LENED|nr:UPF0183-domain-containing protein [Lentinula edodes]
MFPTLDVELRPGFGLGASLWNIINMIRQMQHLFPQVDIKYDPDASSTTPIILHLRPHLDLLFSGKHQRLRTICVRKLRDTSPPKRVWFSFEEEGIGEGRKGNAHNEDRLQEVKRVLISQKEVDTEQGDALGEVAECPIMNSDIALAIVKVHDGVTLQFYPSNTASLHVRIGTTTAQDLAVSLGRPLRVHYKEDDRMTIHSSLQDESDTGYFYNYFQHGIDFYISGKNHVVKKIILQSNVPGSPLFQVYKRCNWEIEGKPEDDEDGEDDWTQDLNYANYTFRHPSEKAVL